jgi:micrococcal nuclease
MPKLKQAAILLILTISGCRTIAQPKTTTEPAAANQQTIQQLETVTIARVSDGDTVKLTDGRKLRLCGIDAPETAKRNKQGQPLGNEATDYLIKLTQKGEIKMQGIETDRYKRTVAELWVLRPGEKIYSSVNVAMVRSGLAWHYAKYSKNCPSQAQIIKAETEAKRLTIGVYRGFNTPPWEFRRR